MIPETDTGHHDIQGLLPWWANGTLGPDECRRVEAHLERCSACQREVVLLMELEEALEEEPAVSRGDRFAAPTAGAAPRRRLVPWLGWAAAAVLALLLGLEPGLERGPTPGRGLLPTPRPSVGRVVPTYRLDAVRRSSADTVLIPGRAAGDGTDGELQLLLHVDLGPGALPLDLVLENAQGRTIFREAGIRNLFDGRFLFVRCATSELPPGRYFVTLRGRGPEAPEEPVQYSFRVVEAVDGGNVEDAEGP